MANSQSKRWVFTLNNYTDLERAELLASRCEYMVVGKEVGDSGTPHLQGYVVLENRSRLSAVKKLQPRAHWEVARGNHKQASDYCKKEGNFSEVGELPSDDQGGDEVKRWDDARKRAMEGDLDNIPADIYVRYYRTLKEIKKDHMPVVPDADDVTGVWIYGDAGIGKSRKAREDYPGAYLKMQNKWWDGYQGEEFVILDDFDCKELGHHLKIWADRYSFVAETKGGAIKIRPKKFVVTSNYRPASDKFGWDQETLAAITRRFKIIHMVSFP